MANRKSMDIFGGLTIGLLSIVNLLHLLWTVWLTAEQLQTGWGFGTGMELVVLYPWLTELICLPGMITGAVFLILSIFKPSKKGILSATLCLFIAAIIQYVLTNLFIFY